MQKHRKLALTDVCLICVLGWAVGWIGLPVLDRHPGVVIPFRLRPASTWDFPRACTDIRTRVPLLRLIAGRFGLGGVEMPGQQPVQQEAQADSALAYSLDGDDLVAYCVLLFVNGAWEESKLRAILDWLDQKVPDRQLQHVVTDERQHAVRVFVGTAASVRQLVEAEPYVTHLTAAKEPFVTIAQLPSDTPFTQMHQAVAFQLYCPELSIAALQKLAHQLRFTSQILLVKPVHHALSATITCGALDVLAKVQTGAFNHVIEAGRLQVQIGSKHVTVKVTRRPVVSFAQLGTLLRTSVPGIDQLQLGEHSVGHSTGSKRGREASGDKADATSKPPQKRTARTRSAAGTQAHHVV